MKALEERREQEREVEAQGRHESEVKAQGNHEGGGEETTREESVEEKEEETHSLHEESHVSTRHLSWWKGAWWIRVNDGPHMRSARGRRRTWRASRQAAEQVCDGRWV